MHNARWYILRITVPHHRKSDFIQALFFHLRDPWRYLNSTTVLDNHQIESYYFHLMKSDNLPSLTLCMNQESMDENSWTVANIITPNGTPDLDENERLIVLDKFEKDVAKKAAEETEGKTQIINLLE